MKSLLQPASEVRKVSAVCSTDVWELHPPAIELLLGEPDGGNPVPRLSPTNPAHKIRPPHSTTIFREIRRRAAMIGRSDRRFIHGCFWDSGHLKRGNKIFAVFIYCSRHYLFSFAQDVTSSPSPSPSAAATPATGGGNGQVWVNSSTHVYHKEGSRFYGKTKHGKYMSEQDAIKEGDHAAKNEH
jgi:hypothetical protein